MYEYVCTISRFIPEGVAKASQIFLWGANVLPKLYLLNYALVLTMKYIYM
jgi:hypothetical protein